MLPSEATVHTFVLPRYTALQAVCTLAAVTGREPALAVGPEFEAKQIYSDVISKFGTQHNYQVSTGL